MLTSLNGTHGTGETSAIQIQQAGFRRSIGRVGTGAYFWAFDNDSTLAHQLARDWAEFKKSQGRVKPGERVVVIYVAIPTDEAEIFDCDQLWFVEMIEKVAQEKQLTGRDRNKIVDLILGKMEARGDTISVLKCSVAFPPDSASVVRYIMGSAKAYVVRAGHVGACQILSAVTC